MNAIATGGTGSPVPGLLIWAGITLAYFIPAIIALFRHVPNTGSVIIVNWLLGWTVVGWIVALAMACRSKPRYIQPQQWGPPVPPQQWGPRQ